MNSSGTYILAFNDDISQALDDISTTNQNAMNDITILKKAAKILRKNIFSATQKFDGSFTQDGVEKSVPPILLSFMEMEMVLDGPSINADHPNESNKGASNESVSLCLQIVFNSFKRRSSCQGVSRHNRSHETPSPYTLQSNCT